MPGADYEAFLGELAKFGSNLVLATQTLARLEALDHAHDRSLRATLFSNLDGLFAFHCSAEDAKYLVPELGGELEVADLVSLGEHRCYARLSAGKERLPVFSVALDSPPPSDPALAVRLAAASARRYGRSQQAVAAAQAAVVARITASHLTVPGSQQASSDGKGRGRVAVAGPGAPSGPGPADGVDRSGKGPRFSEEESPVRTKEDGGLPW
jgi:hypothetical protein